MGEKAGSAQCLKCFTSNPPDLPFCGKCGAPLAKTAETLSYGSGEKDAAGLEEAVELAPGSLFDGRFRIIEEIGRGGMGQVFKAEDTHLNITVALKIIRPRHSSNPAFIERFKKETLTARAVAHENVIRIFDLGEAGGIKYISMEYIKGQNLRDLIRASGSLSVQAVLHLGRQLCEGLAAAHDKGIVHQDLKPSNIMVDNGGRAYIMDFGLARSLTGPEPGGGRGPSGTPPYMSPEQARGEKAGARSDIYSLGVMLYEMCAGEPPFTADTAEDYVRKHLTEIPMPPSRLNPEIPASIERVILRCLEKDGEKRYPDVRSLLDDIKKLKPDSQGRARARGKKRRTMFSALLILLIAAGFIIWKARGGGITGYAKKPSLAVVYMTNNTGDPALDWGRKAFSELLMTDLLQSKHIRVVTPNKLYETLQKLNLLEAEDYSSGDLERAGKAAGVNHILHGNYSMAGGMLRIDAILYRLGSLELVAAEQVTGKGTESIFAMIDELTKKIKAGLKLSPDDIRMDRDKDIRSITTDSPEALRYFIEGTKAYNESRFEESNGLLLKAVGLDPGFALAYSRISENYYYLGDAANGSRYLQKALSLLNRVSDREYHLIQGQASRSAAEAVENYKKLLDLYPDDPEGNAYLGALYRQMEEWDLAEEKFKLAAAADPGDSLAVENLSYISRAKGLYEKAEDIIQSHQGIFPGPAPVHMNLAYAGLCRRDFDFAAAEAGKALAAEPENPIALELQGLISQSRGDFGGAEGVYGRLAGSKTASSEFMGRHWLCWLDVLRGRFRRALNGAAAGTAAARADNHKTGMFNFKLLEAYLESSAGRLPEALKAAGQAVELAHEIDYPEYKVLALHARGLIYVRMNDAVESAQAAQKLKSQIEESGVLKWMRYDRHLLGEIARSQGRLEEAIGHFRSAESLLPREYFKIDDHVMFLDSLASAYYQKGDWRRAKTEYGRITELTTGRLKWGDRYVRGYYRLGKICLKQRKPRAAAAAFARFLDLWNDADPGIPEIEDALRELASLKK